MFHQFVVGGGNISLGVETLMDHGVLEENIYILTLFASPVGKYNLFLRTNR